MDKNQCIKEYLKGNFTRFLCENLVSGDHSFIEKNPDFVKRLLISSYGMPIHVLGWFQIRYGDRYLKVHNSVGFKNYFYLPNFYESLINEYNDV